MKLNCDLGESFGCWTMGLDAQVMPHIDQANIACGFHGGDPLVMQKTLELAKKHQVSVGAHPGYPDLVGFGRRSLNCSQEEIIAMVKYQVAAIDGVAKSLGVALEYVKPHGALYNDMMAKANVREAILVALSSYHKPLKLMLQATPYIDEHKAQAKIFNIDILSEAFADRCYDDDGKLLSRTQEGAVHNREKMLAQVKQLKEHGSVTTISGNTLNLAADSLCVHGDNIEGVQAIEAIRELIG
ncbi:MAG: 5-oxoprolinase subunit PxpA [Colwellia sp.]|nr:5-oxoprolinase subunit PxpA [Colwellia sp.]MCW8865584.1 5-oxoprolinase subunit PxpA [Colwellia sp.]MCW9080926.1 5-oxoprolinase subunit PxpA [Colwellia sp.]